MGIGGLLLGLWVASSSTANGFADLPLSPEDLALLESLEGTATAAADRAPWWPAPIDGHRRVAAAALNEPVARSVVESFDLAPTVVGTFRGGERMGVDVEGGRVDPIVGGAASRWLSLSPLMLGAATITRTPRLGDDSRTSAARLNLTLRPAPDLFGSSVAATTFARSADRSAGIFAVASVANEVSGLTFLARFDRQGPLRVPTLIGSEDVGDTHRTLGLSARGRLLGDESEPIRVDVGADYDAIFDGEAQIGGMVINRRHDTLLHTFVDADLRLGAFEAHAAARMFGYQRRYEIAMFDEVADVTQVEADILFNLVPWFAVLGGAEAALGFVDTTAVGALDRTEGFVGARVDTERFDAELTLRLNRYTTTFGDRTVAADHVLVGGRGALTIVGPLSFEVSAHQGVTPIAVDDLALYADDRLPAGHETSVTVDVGPSITTDALWLTLHVFGSWVDNTTVLFPNTRLGASDARWVGFEAEGRWLITDNLSAAGTAAYTKVTAIDPDVVIDGVASVRLYGTLRYDLRERRAYVALHGRGTLGPFGEERAAQVVDLRTNDGTLLSGGVVFAASGGLTLADGLLLSVTINNVLDQVVVRHDRDRPTAGVDLRAMLSYTL